VLIIFILLAMAAVFFHVVGSFKEESIFDGGFNDGGDDF